MTTLCETATITFDIWQKSWKNNKAMYCCFRYILCSKFSLDSQENITNQKLIHSMFSIPLCFFDSNKTWRFHGPCSFNQTWTGSRKPRQLLTDLCRSGDRWTPGLRICRFDGASSQRCCRKESFRSDFKRTSYHWSSDSSSAMLPSPDGSSISSHSASFIVINITGEEGGGGGGYSVLLYSYN